MDERVLNGIMRVIVTGLVVGMLGMIQPFSLALFKPAFLILFYCVLGYIVFSHFNPRPAKNKGAAPAVKTDEAESREDA
jgi:hypothetical protein